MFCLIFFTTFGKLLIKRVTLNLNNKSSKIYTQFRGFLSNIFETANIYFQFQDICCKAYSLCYKFLNYCFYIVENIITIFNFLVFFINDKWIIQVFVSNMFPFINIYVFH